MAIRTVHNSLSTPPPEFLAREELAKRNLFYVALSVVMLATSIFAAMTAPWYVPIIFFALSLAPFIYWHNSKGEALTLPDNQSVNLSQ